MGLTPSTSVVIAPITVGAAQVEKLTAIASSALGAGRVVKVVAGSASYFQPGADNPLSLLAITMTAPASGASVDVATDGTLTTLTGLTPGPLWAGPNGTLTPTPQTTGTFVFVGHATNPTTLIIEFGEPVAL
jgi:hypothetical protein